MSDPASMSPMDAFRWFVQPVETVYSGTGNIDQLVPANPRRIALFIDGNQSNVGRVATNPATLLTSGAGAMISSTRPLLEFRQADHGNIAQVAWYVQANFGAIVTVIEVLLLDWPSDATRESVL